ncbi:MAG: hypothetical protein AB7K71_07680 [Polyangiaceae bacterium]
MKTREEHLGKMETKMKHWGTKLDSLAESAESAEKDLAAGYRETVAELKAKYAAAQRKYDALKEERGEKWEELREELNDAWHDLESAFTKFTS